LRICDGIEHLSSHLQKELCLDAKELDGDCAASCLVVTWLVGRVTGQVLESKLNDRLASKRWVAECKRLSFVLILYVAKRGNEIVFRDSVVTPFAVKMRKLSEHSVQNASQETPKALINDLYSFSQAGRRGLDPRLPLQLFNNLQPFSFSPLHLVNRKTLDDELTQNERIRFYTACREHNQVWIAYLNSPTESNASSGKDTAR